jgi:hypothetical protein
MDLSEGGVKVRGRMLWKWTRILWSVIVGKAISTLFHLFLCQTPCQAFPLGFGAGWGSCLSFKGFPLTIVTFTLDRIQSYDM